MPDFPPKPLTRRGFLGLMTAAAGATLAGCASRRGAVPSEDMSLLDLNDPVRTEHDAEADNVVHDPQSHYSPPADFHLKTYHAPPRPVAVNDPMGIIPRSAWALAGPNMRTVQPMDGVNLITFHHTGDPHPIWFDSFQETARHWELIREYERSRGFQDIGYHFGIDRAGRIWQLRPLMYRGEHVRPSANGKHIWNDHNIGVVSLGNFMLQSPTPQQLLKVRLFGHLLRTRYNLAIDQVKTHQELVATLCPGLHMQPYMVYIRRRGLM